MADTTYCSRCQSTVFVGEDRRMSCGHVSAVRRPSPPEIEQDPVLRDRFPLVLEGFIL